jgi:hypothetical protein
MNIRQIDNSDNIEISRSKTIITETSQLYSLADLYAQLEAINKQRDEQNAARDAEAQEVQSMIDAVGAALPDLAAKYEASKILPTPPIIARG